VIIITAHDEPAHAALHRGGASICKPVESGVLPPSSAVTTKAASVTPAGLQALARARQRHSGTSATPPSVAV
jgi:hypothetical protein